MTRQKIIGHQKQIEQMERSLKEGRLPHALLFSGMEGIGKKQVALFLAQTLLKRIPHPDCHLIMPEKNRIKIETIRELKQKLMLYPLEGPVKITIMDDAHVMTLGAANALLKILEEPPALTHFILISSRPSYLLPTIRSRCQRIDFSPLSEREIETWLIQQGIEKNEAMAKARYAQGSLNKAMQFSAQTFDEIKSQFEALKKNPHPSQISALCEQWMENEEHLTTVLSVLRYLWHQKITVSPAQEDNSQWLEGWDQIESAQKALDGYPNKQLLLENLLFNLTAP